MPGKGFVSLTDEVPRGSSGRSISCVYKAKPKGFSYAPAVGRATPQPHPQGCLQRQSMPSVSDGRKAKPQSASRASASSWDKLAPAKKRSPTPGLLLRTVAPRGEKSWPRVLPVPRVELCPSPEPHAPAFGRGRPVRESRSPVQYEELPSLRQRGGGGFGLPLTHWKCAFDLARARSKIRVRCRASEARRRFRWFEKFGNWS